MSIIAYIGRRFFSLVGWYGKRALLTKILIAAAVLFGGYYMYTSAFSSTKAPQYQTAQVEKGQIISTLSESGNVSSVNQVNITSPTDGVIQEVYVKNGDIVSAGDNLFKVRSTATPAQQASAYASYLSAQNSLNAAQAKMNSLQETLFKANQSFVKDAGTPNPDTADPKYIEERAAWLQAESDYKNQGTVIAQAQAALNSAALAYQATKDSIVTAPIDGSIANFSAVSGSNVSASNANATTTSTSSTATGSTVLVIGDFSHLSVKASVSEVDIPKIKTGQKATITLDAFPDKTYVGRVDSLDTIGTSSSGVVTYTIYITFISPPANIHPGMTASVIIQIDKRNDVLMVPTAAVEQLRKFL
jgi:macrolide-specific efflux system membrane fusion protein